MHTQPKTTTFQAHPWHGLPAHSEVSGAFNAYIEIVPSDTVKYELDKATGHLKIDRPQQFSSQCPTLYGLIPRTLCASRVAERARTRCNLEPLEGDGDPMDVCVLSEKSAAHGGFLCRVRPIGGLRMIDGEQADDKIIAVLDGDLTYGGLRELKECPAGIIDRLRHYFLSYKQGPDTPSRKVQIAEVYGRDEALVTLQMSMEDYATKFSTP
jgi:inorganic pyrophosphatase